MHVAKIQNLLAILQGGLLYNTHVMIYSMEEAIANLKLALDDKSFTILHRPSIHWFVFSMVKMKCILINDKSFFGWPLTIHPSIHRWYTGQVFTILPFSTSPICHLLNGFGAV
jgi:hypothetical protein